MWYQAELNILSKKIKDPMFNIKYLFYECTQKIYRRSFCHLFLNQVHETNRFYLTSFVSDIIIKELRLLQTTEPVSRQLWHWIQITDSETLGLLQVSGWSWCQQKSWNIWATSGDSRHSCWRQSSSVWWSPMDTATPGMWTPGTCYQCPHLLPHKLWTRCWC